MRGLRSAAAVLVVALALVACTPNTAPTALAQPTPTPTPSAAPVASPSALSTASPAAAVEVDPTLLELLPAEIDGQALRPDAETAAGIAGTADLAPDIEARAVGLYIAPGASNADDFAIVNVVRLRPGVFSDSWFRDWRETYDEAACEIAGGVAPGVAQTQIGDHETYIGTCQAGVHTYHVHLASPDRVISITSLGTARFGERVVAGLTE